MRWSTIRLIWMRELRDQLRDRRTLFTILALPMVLYPLMSVLVLQFARQLLNQPSTIGIVLKSPDAKTFPAPGANAGWRSALAAANFVTSPPMIPGSMDRIVAAAALTELDRQSFDYLPLIQNGAIPEPFSLEQEDGLGLFPGDGRLQFQFLKTEEATKALISRQVDVVVSAPENFLRSLEMKDRPVLRIEGRPNDDRSRRAAEQFSTLLQKWKTHVKEVRLRRAGLPEHFDDPFAVTNMLGSGSREIGTAESLLEMLVRTFPFMLVMWSLVGALYPAVDLCAGEKERGTMETLLISPTDRAEIVYGKFLTIWVFSAITALMHLISMFIGTAQLRSYLPESAVTIPALFWCIVLVLPLSAVFSAVSLAIGAYARSSKEGQYYLMPLFWVTMPLVFLTLVPGVELNQFYSMVPVTGVALLMQRLMMTPSLEQAPWFYFFPVFATAILYSWLGLRWAIVQFQREEVLFRQAERLELGLWLRSLFRQKDALPSFGQALFCFVMLVALRWKSSDLGLDLPLIGRYLIILMAFVAAPPLFMSLMLTRQPRRSLRLVWPRPAFVGAALLLLPMAEVAHYIMLQSPQLYQLLADRRSLIVNAARPIGNLPAQIDWGVYIVIVSVLPGVAKEFAFRGFILSGLRQRLAPWPAIFLSSFLFAVFHMNVFSLIPIFIMGVILGWLAVYSGSILPSILLHIGCNILLLSGPLATTELSSDRLSQQAAVLPHLLVLAFASALLALMVLRQVGRANGRPPGPVPMY